MPTNRKRRVHGRHFDDGMFPAMLIHVEHGDCYLAGVALCCGCGLRDDRGVERVDIIEQIKKDQARHL